MQKLHFTLSFLVLFLVMLAIPGKAQVNLTNGLIAYFPFSGNANDASGNGNNPVFNNATLTTDRSGNPNSAYYFNGVDNYIQIPNSTSLDPNNQLSVCAYVMPMGFYYGTCHGNSMIMKGDADFLTGNYGLRFSDAIYTNGNNCFTPVVDSVHQTFYGVTGSEDVTDFIQKGQWYCVVYTYDGTYSRLYVDGVIKDSVSSPGLTFSNSYDLYFGHMNNTTFPYWFNGVLDEIRIYNRALNRDEVGALCGLPSCPLMAVTGGPDTTVCPGAPVQFIAKGAATYSWSPASGLSDSTLSDPVATPSVTTSYIVTGTVANGCTAKDTVIVAIFPPIAPILTPDTGICLGSPVQLRAEGGVSYTWSPAQYLDDPGIASPLARPDTTTRFFLKVLDLNNCTEMDSVTVSIRPIPVFLAPADAIICKGSSIMLGDKDPGQYRYAWSPADSLNAPSSPTPIADPSSTTVYTVMISDSVCADYDSSFSVSVTVKPSPAVTAQKNNDIDCSVATSQLNASGAFVYSWTPAEGLSDPNISNPLVSIDSTTTFIVRGTAGNGCAAFDTVTVKVTATGRNLFIVPNAFTPNGDGHNDCFGIRRWGDVTLEEFSVYNRWGVRVFTTRNPSECWDGSFGGKPQEAGAYPYVIKASSFCGMITRTGLVMLIR